MGTLKTHKARALPRHRQLLEERMVMVRQEVLSRLVGDGQSNLMDGIIDVLAHATPKDRVDTQQQLLKKFTDSISKHDFTNTTLMAKQLFLVRRFESWCLKEWVLNMAPEDSQDLENWEGSPYGYVTDILNDLYDDIVIRQNQVWSGSHKPSLKKKQMFVEQLIQTNEQMMKNDLLGYFRKTSVQSYPQLLSTFEEARSQKDQALQSLDPDLLRLSELRLAIVEVILRHGQFDDSSAFA